MQLSLTARIALRIKMVYWDQMPYSADCLLIRIKIQNYAYIPVCASLNHKFFSNP